MYQQMRLLDGSRVESFEAKFKGALDVDEADVEALAADQTVLLVVAATVDDVSFKRTNEGGRKRVNGLRLVDARVVKGEMRDELVEVFDLDLGQLTLSVATGKLEGYDDDEDDGPPPTPRRAEPAAEAEEPKVEMVSPPSPRAAGDPLAEFLAEPDPRQQQAVAK